VFQLQGDVQDIVGERFHAGDACHALPDVGQRSGIPQLDVDLDVALRDALAGQHIVLAQFLGGQEVALVGQLLHLALDQAALAGTAAASTTVVRKGDALAQGRLQQGLLRPYPQLDVRGHDPGTVRGGFLAEQASQHDSSP
jgi:hypothetical protein